MTRALLLPAVIMTAAVTAHSMPTGAHLAHAPAFLGAARTNSSHQGVVVTKPKYANKPRHALEEENRPQLVVQEEADEEGEADEEEEADQHAGGARGRAHHAGGGHQRPQAEELETDTPMTMDEETVEGNEAINSVKNLAKHVMLPGMSIFLLSIMCGNAMSMSKWFNWVPESATIIFVSILLGLSLRNLIAGGLLSNETFTFMNATLLNLGLLPIIIFNSGWSLRTKDFVSQIEYILIFAIFGTLISTFFIGYTLWWLSNHFSFIRATLSIRECLAFASLISAVDPVATLSTYAEMDMPSTQPLLNIMVFGESAINDAVAIVLFEIFNEGWEEFSYVDCALQMTKLLFGSMFFGMFTACVLIYLMRVASLPGHTSAELLYIWACGYCVYALCEATGFSGIIAVLFAGILFGIYARKHLSRSASDLANEYLALCAKTADTAVFILCGTSTAMMSSARGLIMGIVGLFLCLIARGFSVSICGAASNALKKAEGESHPLDFKTQLMMWHGGLRGGIALVLALELNAEWCEHKGMFINATFFIICTLLLLLGSTTELLIKKLGFTTTKQDEHALMEPDRWYSVMFKDSNKLLHRILVGTDEEKPDPASGGLSKLKIEKLGIHNRPTVKDGELVDEQSPTRRSEMSSGRL